jgi:hypothetical protein
MRAVVVKHRAALSEAFRGGDDLADATIRWVQIAQT